MRCLCPNPCWSVQSSLWVGSREYFLGCSNRSWTRQVLVKSMGDDFWSSLLMMITMITVMVVMVMVMMAVLVLMVVLMMVRLLGDDGYSRVKLTKSSAGYSFVEKTHAYPCVEFLFLHVWDTVSNHVTVNRETHIWYESVCIQSVCIQLYMQTNMINYDHLFALQTLWCLVYTSLCLVGLQAWYRCRTMRRFGPYDRWGRVRHAVFLRIILLMPMFFAISYYRITFVCSKELHFAMTRWNMVKDLLVHVVCLPCEVGSRSLGSTGSLQISMAQRPCMWPQIVAGTMA